VTLTLTVPLSNNNEGQTRHFTASLKWKRLYAKALAGHKAAPPVYPQRITITRILGKGERLWDADSVLRGSAKQLIDALKDAGFMTDDSPRYITEVFGKQDASQRPAGPAIKIEFERAKL